MIESIKKSQCENIEGLIVILISMCIVSTENTSVLYI